MTLAPLLSASPEIKLHAFAAMAAFALGVVQLAAPKGTLPNRTLGWIFAALVAVSSAFIHTIRLWGQQLRQIQRNLGRVLINRVYPRPILVVPGYTPQSGGRAALLSSSCFLHPSPSQCDQ